MTNLNRLKLGIFAAILMAGPALAQSASAPLKNAEGK